MNSKPTEKISDEDYWYNSWLESLNEDESDKPSINVLFAKPRQAQQPVQPETLKVNLSNPYGLSERDL